MHSALTAADFCNIAATAEAAKAAIADVAGKIAATFEPQGTDAESKAKPEIWTSWDDSLAKADGLAKAAALDATSLEGVQAGMKAIGGACKDCHTYNSVSAGQKISRNRRG